MGKYKIAGITIKIEPRYELAKKQLEPYRVDDEVKEEAVFRVSDEEFAFAMKNYPDDPDLAEYAYMRYLMRFLGDSFDFLVLHSSAVVHEGRAYLFSADSGVGKSTHTRHWLQNFGGQGAFILNDDSVTIRKFDGVWNACGTPWAGSSLINVNTQVPLQGIGFIERAEFNRVEKISPDQAIGLFLKQSPPPQRREMLEKRLDRIISLLKEIPAYRVQCLDDPSAALTSYAAMGPKK